MSHLFMKTALASGLLTLVTTTSLQAATTSLETIDESRDPRTGALVEERRPGFYDDSFWRRGGQQRRRSFCYHGSANDVCALIAEAAEASQDAYRQGDHSRWVLDHCEVKEDSPAQVEARYTLSDDYHADSLTLSQQIDPC